MNSVLLIGRLARDAKESTAKTKDGDMCVARFTLAVDRTKDQADFISCVAFGRIAELICDRCRKGSKIGIQGRIQTGSYKDKDGNMVYTTDVVADRMDFCDSKPDAEKPADPDPVDRASSTPARPQSRYTRENR